MNSWGIIALFFAVLAGIFISVWRSESDGVGLVLGIGAAVVAVVCGTIFYVTQFL